MSKSYADRIRSLSEMGETDMDTATDYQLGLFNGRETTIDDCARIASEADATVARLEAENESLKARADSLASANERLRKDAERYRFVRWYQDFDQAPEYLRDILLQVHRRAHERGALRPSAEEYETGLDEAMAALAARSQEGA